MRPLLDGPTNTTNSLPKCRDASTAFRVTDRIASDRDLLDALRVAHARARERFWELHGAPQRLTIDIDATLISAHSEKEGAAGIGIIGHITKEELLRQISGTELANGFFNRFMLAAVQRSKKLPFGGALTDSDLDTVRQHVVAATRFAGQQIAPLQFDAKAREKWIAV